MTIALGGRRCQSVDFLRRNVRHEDRSWLLCSRAALGCALLRPLQSPVHRILASIMGFVYFRIVCRGRMNSGSEPPRDGTIQYFNIMLYGLKLCVWEYATPHFPPPPSILCERCFGFLFPIDLAYSVLMVSWRVLREVVFAFHGFSDAS